jgi:ABC-2 type transport system permease protein
MKQLMVFIRKEFYHVFRDRRTLLVMFGLPVVQILLFGYAMTSEMKNARIVIVDHARDVQSMQLQNKILSSSYFTLAATLTDDKAIEQAFKGGSVQCALVFPRGFGNANHYGRF